MHQTCIALKKHTSLLGSLLLAALAVVASTRMISLDNQQRLWGYWPLWLFIGAWGALVLGIVAWRQWRGKPVSWLRLGLSTLSGLLLGLAFPSITPLPFLMFVGWIPLLWLADDVQAQSSRPGRSLLPYVYHSMVVWNIIATFWVANAAVAAGIFAIWVNSLLMCLPWIGWTLGRKHSARLAYAPLIAYWLTFEYVHLNWDLTWPWLNLGNGFAEWPSLVQWYEYTGTFGGSLWVWLVNIAAFRLWTAYRAGEPWRGFSGRVALLVLVPMAYSVFSYLTYDEKGAQIEVVAVQPNYEPHYEKFSVPEEIQLERFIELSLSKLDTTVDYLVFPESSFGYVEENEINEYPSILRLREALAGYPGLNVVTGLNAYHDFGPGEPLSKAARERRRGSQVIQYEALNSSAQFTIGNNEVYTYRKSKLVPGPEAFPFQSVLFFMKPLVEKLDGTTAGLGTQPLRTVFPGAQARVGSAICYESIFGEYFNGYIRPRRPDTGPSGAQAVFIITNDGWWDDTPGHRQHLHFASLRAIETRRSLVRSANTGVSAFVNQRGDISQALAYNQTGAIRASMTLNDELTFYVIWGDMIARIALFLTLIMALNTFVRARLPEK